MQLLERGPNSNARTRHIITISFVHVCLLKFIAYNGLSNQQSFAISTIIVRIKVRYFIGRIIRGDPCPGNPCRADEKKAKIYFSDN